MANYRGKQKYKGITLDNGAGQDLAGITATTAELNIMDGVTATATEINTALDGVTATAAEINQLDGTTLTAGITVTGSLVKLSETMVFGDFTDGGSTAGTYDITAGTIPAGATFLYAAVTACTGFAGDTSAVLTIGDGSDADRYNTGTPDVFSDVAAGVAMGDPSGTRYHATAATVTLTVTTAADFTSVSAGGLTVELYYLT